MARKAHTAAFVFVHPIPPTFRTLSSRSRFRLQIKERLVVLTHARYDGVADGPLRFVRHSSFAPLSLSLSPARPFYSISLCSYLLSYSNTARYPRGETEGKRKRARRRATLYRKSGCCSASRALVSHIITVRVCSWFLPVCSASSFFFLPLLQDRPLLVLFSPFTHFALTGISLPLALVRDAREATRRDATRRARYFLLSSRP